MQVGAVLPSSRALAKTMLSKIDFERPGYLIELGGGTGSFTKAILDMGFDPKKLVVIERNPTFVTLLKKQFPNSLILQADAQNLKTVLQAHNINPIQINAILSGIPLRSLPMLVLINILNNVREVLPRKSVFIQFTYGLRTPVPPDLLSSSDFRIQRSHRVWKNIPPAKVWLYEKK